MQHAFGFWGSALWSYLGEIVAHEVFVALGDVVAVERLARFVLILPVYFLIRDLGRACVVGVDIGASAALLATGVFLALHADGGGRCVHTAWGSIYGFGVARTPARCRVAA